MKFIHYMEKVNSVDVYGTMSLVCFGLFFIIMLAWVFKTNKKQFEEASRIPLDN
ncbi:MAG: CcoQ/FixQ family Cbb3-type cytochrome c oxidase assembly chaperone [Bacteroidetes bacterium]|nr:CcoQ/FixQ family Cbb3-type cytochrome c oxidase assembly chaperone [Bacteroidota bacterium]